MCVHVFAYLALFCRVSEGYLDKLFDFRHWLKEIQSDCVCDSSTLYTNGVQTARSKQRESFHNGEHAVILHSELDLNNADY